MFPKSLVFAFVASCLFLANVGVEASTSGKFRRDNGKGKQVLASTILVNSILSNEPGIAFGGCTLPFAHVDEYFKPAVDTKARPIQKFITEAQKHAHCVLIGPNYVECVENIKKVVNKPGDVRWWEQAFCKCCSEAGGENAEEHGCSGSKGGKEGGKGVEDGSEGTPV
ncbi:hypothetical protein NDA10_006346 [Ustilago hordei]|nr:hypothetical protein NDA10_003240 [Ustilago hordei]KAJ1042600.1 hypothetical protein NDA10_006346 [Ustilago hordei]